MINTLEKVYSDLDKMNVEVLNCPMLENISVSSPDGYIGINYKSETTTVELCTILAHEAGHFLSGAFYYGYSPHELKSTVEARACRAAIEKYIPYKDLLKCFQCGITEIWELAEFFGVHDDIIRCAHHHYTEVRGMGF